MTARNWTEHELAEVQARLSRRPVQPASPAGHGEEPADPAVGKNARAAAGASVNARLSVETGTSTGDVRESSPPLRCTIGFHVPGEPVAKARARGGVNGHHYTPQKTRSYERRVATVARLAMGGLEPFPASMPLAMLLVVTMPVPTSWPKWKKAAAVERRLHPTKRPDLDNFLKSVLDGCTKSVFVDDSSIVRLVTRKEYGSTPGVWVRVEPIVF